MTVLRGPATPKDVVLEDYSLDEMMKFVKTFSDSRHRTPIPGLWEPTGQCTANQPLSEPHIPNTPET